MFTLSLKALCVLAPFVAFSSGAVLEYRKQHHSGGGTITASNGTCASETPVLSCQNTVRVFNIDEDQGLTAA
jgi:hypothetical protein